MTIRSRLTPWPTLPLAVGASLGGQACLLYGFVAAGVAFYATALSLLALFRDERNSNATVPAPDLSREVLALLLLCVLFAALVLRRFQLDQVPWGLNNDEGIEGLIACRFMTGTPITPFSDIGVSRETLFHVLLIPLFHVFRPGIWPLRLLSGAAGLAAVGLVYLVGRRLFSSARLGLLGAALLAVSPWHLLYSRTGLRNILAPVFLLAAVWLWHRAEERKGMALFVLFGAVLGVGMYTYTSFRVVPLLVVAWAWVRRVWFRRPALGWKRVLAAAIPFLALITPQMAVFLRDPSGFVARGSYVLTQTPRASYTANLLYSFLMPVIYPARFGVVQTDYYFGDGISLVYAAVGRTPETWVSAALMACGFMLAVSRTLRRRGEGEAVLLLLFLGTTATVGIAGPSLSRLITNVPLLSLMGALTLDGLFLVLQQRFRSAIAWLAVGVLVSAAGCLAYHQYFNLAGRSERAMFHYAYPQTVIGLFAASRPPDHPVLVFTTEEPETVQFLTFSRRRLTALYRDPDALDLEKIRTALGHLEFVMENHRRFLELFTTLIGIFPAADSSYLSDPRHLPDRRVAYVLDALPASRISPGSSTPSPGRPTPSRGTP
ncbi:MAG TPA: glycosyltransferase family 39 protein [Candidatus Polarisedimenticolia bacterium]|nr:glycosyltransferase family 39 protein [Candidatus Polarisedimenticolia bacterium]